MTVESTAPDKLSIIVFSGDYERIHYAFVMAGAAAAIDRSVTVFFTMDGIGALCTHQDWSMHEAERRTKGVATLEELITACVELDVTFMVCEQGLRLLDIQLEDLRRDIPVRAGGVVSFLGDASRDGAMLFV